MATVWIQKPTRKRKSDTSYKVYYRDPETGRNKYYRVFSRKKDADTAAAKLRYLLETGKMPEKKKRFAPKTFREIAVLLIAHWHRERDLSEVTFDGYCQRLDFLGRIFFGPGLLSEIRREDIVSFHNFRAEYASPATANRDLFILKQIFGFALEIGAVKENPLTTISFKSEKVHERNEYLLPTDLKRLVKAARKGRARFYLPVLIFLGAEHCASKQEALSLRWSDINFDYMGQGMISFFRTKNKTKRTEFLMPWTREALISWREHLNMARKRKRVEAKDDWVFCRLDGTPKKSFKSAWDTARKSAGMIDFHFHDLRHTFCSNSILVGAGLKDVKEMAGHRDLAMTDRYTHLPTVRKKEIQKALARHYAGDGRQDGGLDGM